MRWILFSLLLLKLLQVEASEVKNNIQIVYTAALIPYKFDIRKTEYIKCLETLGRFGYGDQIYVVHSGGDTPLSFFEEYSDHVIHTNTNDLRLRNKGVNEAISVLKALQSFDFDDEDILVKLTGRYLLEDDYFLKYIENHPECDAFARYLTPCDPPKIKIVAGCFAMRGKYFKQCFRGFDFEKMETEEIDIEQTVQEFLQKLASENIQVAYLDSLHLTALVGTTDLVKW
jgi:hypothetical protein